MAVLRVPDAERLARRKEEWLRLLEAALPEAELAEPAPAAAEAPSRGEEAAATLAPEDAAPAGGREAAEGPASLLALGLECLFGEARPRQEAPAMPSARMGTGVGAGVGAAFRVRVPRQYPGVQYRKSKNLNDRYPRYAKLGTVVTGHVEDDGEWLRISEEVFLPMKVGGVQILEPCLQDALGNARVESSTSIKSLWFACSHGSHGEEQEVVTDVKETN